MKTPWLMLTIIIMAFAVVVLAIGNAASADTYTYDTLGRLTGVTYSGGSTITYTYDAAGNRTAVASTP